jgi:hypothetical protein
MTRDSDPRTGDVVYLAAFRSERRESRLRILKDLERNCLESRGLGACPDCAEFPGCRVWQESLRSVIGYVQDGLRCKPQTGDVVQVAGTAGVVLRVYSALDVMAGMDVAAASRFSREQRAWLGTGWLGLYYRIACRTNGGSVVQAEWHQVEGVQRGPQAGSEGG